MECYQRGIITTKDTGGMKLEWGYHHLMNDLIEKMARREGFGDVLADGSVFAARNWVRERNTHLICWATLRKVMT